MNIKQNVVIKNKFSSKYHKGGGSTPGNFLERYVSRKQATEALAGLYNNDPSINISKFLQRYIMRRSATEQAIKSYSLADKLANTINTTEAFDGIAFNQDSISINTSQMKATAKKLQSLYDSGHTVSKLIISFRTDYLKKYNVIDSDFEFDGRGSFKSNVDQLKLRQGLNKAMANLVESGEYVNPVWGGAVQLDTEHVHAHIVLADDVDLKKSHRLYANSTQLEDKGKVTASQKRSFRLGLQNSLESTRDLATLRKASYYDKANFKNNLEYLQYSKYATVSKLQKLTASLPKNTALWSMSSDASLMSKPKRLMYEYLNQLIDNHDDRLEYLGITHKIDDVAKYQSDELGEDREMVVNNLNSQVLDSMGDSVLESLKVQIPKNTLNQKSDYLIQQAIDENNPNEAVDILELNDVADRQSQSAYLAFRLARYHKRQSQHQKQAFLMNQQLDIYDVDDVAQGLTSQESPIRNWYKDIGLVERMQTDKYRYLFRDIQRENDDNYLSIQKGKGFQLNNQAERLEKLMTLQLDSDSENIHSLLSFIDNPDNETFVIDNQEMFKRLQNHQPISKDESVLLDSYENNKTMLGTKLYYGTQTYNFKHDILQEAKQYARDVHDYSFDNWSKGFCRYDDVIDANDITDKLLEGKVIKPKIASSVSDVYTPSYFDDIKGSDMHDVIYDYAPNDFRGVSNKAAKTYSDTLDLEIDSSQKLDDYLKDRNQVNDLVLTRLQIAKKNKELADSINETHILPVLEDEDVSVGSKSQVYSRQLAAMPVEEADVDVNEHLNALSSELQVQNKILDNQFKLVESTPNDLEVSDEQVVKSDVKDEDVFESDDLSLDE